MWNHMKLPFLEVETDKEKWFNLWLSVQMSTAIVGEIIFIYSLLFL